MEKKIPTYRIIVNPDDEKTGVYAVSLVDTPAIEVDWIKLSKEIVDFEFSVGKDKQMLFGPLLIPNKLIYRRDEKGNEYNIMFDEDTIQTIADKYNENKLGDIFNFQHSDKKVNASLLQNWITGSVDKSKEMGFDLPKGTWFGGVKVKDEKFWSEEVKTEKVKGFSVEITAGTELVKMSVNSIMASRLSKPKSVMAVRECLGCPPNGDGTTAKGEPDRRCKDGSKDKVGVAKGVSSSKENNIPKSVSTYNDIPESEMNKKVDKNSLPEPTNSHERYLNNLISNPDAVYYDGPPINTLNDVLFEYAAATGPNGSESAAVSWAKKVKFGLSKHKSIVAKRECLGCPPNGDGTTAKGEPDRRCKDGGDKTKTTTPKAAAPKGPRFGPKIVQESATTKAGTQISIDMPDGLIPDDIKNDVTKMISTAQDRQAEVMKNHNSWKPDGQSTYGGLSKSTEDIAHTRIYYNDGEKIHVWTKQSDSGFTRDAKTNPEDTISRIKSNDWKYKRVSAENWAIPTGVSKGITFP
jgi:hypothetical protein